MTTEEAQKLAKFQEALSGDNEEDLALISGLLDAEGKLKVDISLPSAYEEEIMAQELLQHLSNYARFTQAWRAARNTHDQARARQMFDQMNYSQLVAALIQNAYPGAKALANELAVLQVKQIKKNRQAQEGN